MIKKYLLHSLLAITSVIGACATQEPLPDASKVKAQLEFIDLDAFDRDLSDSLRSDLPTVSVMFMQGASPSALPDRIQQWLYAVEAGNGKVEVTPPSSGVTSKSPLLLLSLVSGIWNSHKASQALKAHEFHRPAQQYDAEVLLKADAQGNRVIDKIVLTKRKTQ